MGENTNRRHLRAINNPEPDRCDQCPQLRLAQAETARLRALLARIEDLTLEAFRHH